MAMGASSPLAFAGRALVGLWMAGVIIATFVVVPPIQGLGNVGRIFIFHVPTAWIAVVAFTIGALFSALYLWRGNAAYDAHAVAASEAGFLFTLLATVTGAIFSQAVWGIFWNWDPRQTSIFVLLLIYAAYFALRSALEDADRRRRLSAVYALFAFVTMPFLFFVAPRVAESTLHPNCALLPGSKCEGVTLSAAEGGVRVGTLGERIVELVDVSREGELVTARVTLTEPGFQGTQAYTLRVDPRTGEAPQDLELDAAQPRIGDSLFRLRLLEVRGDQLLLTIRSPGNTSLLSSNATQLTFFASLLGFTLLYAWMHGVRVNLLGVEERMRREELLAV